MVDSAETSKPTPRLRGRARKLALIVGVILATYVLADLALTQIAHRTGLIPPRCEQYHEYVGEGPICEFSPVSGYRVNGYPSRWLVVAPDGKVQSWGMFRGNNLGFPDGDDFRPQRTRPGARRFAVFGDSMTASQFIPRNWPTACEEMAKEKGSELELLNFAVDGGGIVNWWGTVTNVLGPEQYDLDGVVFAVCCDDLYRGMYIVHDEYELGRHRFGRVPGMNPRGFPRTVAEAEPFLLPGWIDLPGLPSAEVDELIAARTTLPAPAEYFLLSKLLLFASQTRHFYPQGKAEGPVPFDADLLSLIGDVRRVLVEQLELPILVVVVPMLSREGEATISSGIPVDKEVFAKELGARIIDGADAFKGLSPTELDDCYLRHEYHWNQRGSDHFARYMLEQISSWPAGGANVAPNAASEVAAPAPEPPWAGPP